MNKLYLWAPNIETLSFQAIDKKQATLKKADNVNSTVHEDCETNQNTIRLHTSTTFICEIV